MKVLVLYGSPRENGNTASVLKEIVKLLALKNIDYEEIYLNRVYGHACIGCNCCKTCFKCVFEDDYSEITRKIMEYDLLVIGSPVYFGGVTSQLKILVDRLQILFNNRDKFNQIINIFFVTTAAENNFNVFKGVKLTLKYLKYIFRSEKYQIICIKNAEEIKKVEQMIDIEEVQKRINYLIN